MIAAEVEGRFLDFGAERRHDPVMQVLAILGWTAFGLGIVVGLLLDLFGLFGNWIILAMVAAAWVLTGFERFGPVGLGILFGLAVLGEVLEAASGAYGARRFGGGRDAVVAAILGGIVGAVVGTPVFPLVGTLIGACLGSFVGVAAIELTHSKRTLGGAAWTGFGATIGRVGGALTKFGVGLAMLVVAAITF